MRIAKCLIALIPVMLFSGCLDGDSTNSNQPGTYSKVDNIPILDIHINITTNNTDAASRFDIDSPIISDEWPIFENLIDFNLSFQDIKDNRITVVGDEWDNTIKFLVMVEYYSNETFYPQLPPLKFTPSFSKLTDITLVAAYNTTNILFHIYPEQDYLIENLSNSTFVDGVWTTIYEVYDSQEKKMYTIYENMTVQTYSSVDVYLSVPF